MALFVKRDEQRSQLQEKLASELQQKLDQRGLEAKETEPALLEDAHETRPAGLVIFILLICLVVIAGIVAFILR